MCKWKDKCISLFCGVPSENSMVNFSKRHAALWIETCTSTFSLRGILQLKTSSKHGYPGV